MKIDNILASLPLAGIIFQRSYSFWRKNIAVANVTHILLGSGLVLLFFGKLIVGTGLLAFAMFMHIVAFIVADK